MKKLKQAITLIPLFFVVFFVVACLRRYGVNNEVERYIFKPVFKTSHLAKRPLHYACIGNDSLPVLLFIHGAPGSWNGYAQQLQDSVLQKRFCMISVDRAGYGKSGEGESETNIFKQASLLQPVIDSIKNNKSIIIIGRSFGAAIATKLAADNQARVKALILIGAAIDPENEKFWWFSKFGKWKLIRWLLPDPLNVATDEKYAHAGQLKKLLPVWEKLTIPVSIMHGADDWLVDTNNVYFARRMLKNAPVRSFILAKTSHMVSNERPEMVKREIFLYADGDKNLSVAK